MPGDLLRDVAAALGVQDPHVDDLDLPAQSADAAVVVAAGADDPRDVRAVPVLVVAGAASGDDVHAVDVVDVAVAVVVEAVLGLLGVGPQVLLEIGMVELDARVEHRDLRAVGQPVPGGGRVDVVVGALGERVLLLEAGVVRVLRHRHRRVVLDAQHARRGPQALPQRLQRLPVAGGDRSRAHQPQPQPEPTARIADRASLVGIEHAAAELDQQPGGRPRLAARTRITRQRRSESAPRPATPRRRRRRRPQRPSGWTELPTSSLHHPSTSRRRPSCSRP